MLRQQQVGPASHLTGCGECACLRRLRRIGMARGWETLSTLVPFSIFPYQSTFLLSSSGGGLPGRLATLTESRRLFLFLENALGIWRLSTRAAQLGQMLSAKCWFSAGQLIASESQAIEIAKDGDSDVIRLEKLIGEFLQFLRSHTLDLLDQFIQPVEMVEIHFLTGQV